jgi:hypothetical protein
MSFQSAPRLEFGQGSGARNKGDHGGYHEEHDGEEEREVDESDGSALYELDFTSSSHSLSAPPSHVHSAELKAAATAGGNQQINSESDEDADSDSDLYDDDSFEFDL